MATRRRGCATPPCLTALLVLLMLAVVVQAGDFGGHVRAAFVPRSCCHPSILMQTRGLNVRGGASTVIEDEDEEEEEEESESEEEDEEDEEIAVAQTKDDEEEEEEEEALDPKLTAAAMKSSAKTKAKLQAQKSAKLKETVSAQLLASDNKKTSVPKPMLVAETKSVVSKKKKKGGGFFRLPYIVRACLNPVTAFAMTRAFWVSLFNLDYPPKEASQDLRSSLEEKGRMGGNTFQSKPKRKMKRGQAKTLSDLPQLNT